MQDRHTPGPWTVETDRFGVFIKGSDGAGLIEPSSEPFGDDGSGHKHVASADRVTLNRERQDANAALIAAAPTMLEALRAVVGRCTACRDHDGGWRASACAMDGHAEANAAIAAATGEAVQA